MKAKSLLQLTLAAILGAAIAVPLASAAPISGKSGKTKKRKDPRTTKSASNDPLADPSRLPFRGRKNGMFTGQLTGIGVDANGHFVIEVMDSSSTVKTSASFDGCGMRLRDIPHLGDWVDKKGVAPFRMQVFNNCIVRLYTL